MNLESWQNLLDLIVGIRYLIGDGSKDKKAKDRKKCVTKRKL